MKRIIIAAICFLFFGIVAEAYNLYAPNSWEPVRKESQDYRMIYSLCESGRAPAYDKNFFNRGSITRYELASILKNILESADKEAFSEEEKTNLAELKKNYRRELDTLGYKEEKSKKEPIIEISGDARIRWTKGEDTDARARVGAKWNISEDTYIQGRGTAEK